MNRIFDVRVLGWLVFGLMGSFYLVGCSDDAIDLDPGIEQTKATSFIKRVLVEKVSSVRCGHCPLAQHDLEELKKEQDRVVSISHYFDGAFTHDQTNYVLEKTSKTYFSPLALIDRDEEGEGTVFYQSYGWRDKVLQELSDSAAVGIGLSSKLENKELNVEVSIERKQSFASDNRLHVFVIEHVSTGTGPSYDQRNYGNNDPDDPFFQQGDFIVGFEHLNTIEAHLSPPDGEELAWVQDATLVDYSVAFDLPDGKSMSDFSVVAFVSEGEIPTSGLLINVQQAEVGTVTSVYD